MERLVILIVLFLFLTTLTTFGQREYDSLYGKPIIVLIESNPWLMVVGSDVPSFALYEKGQVIYKATKNDSVKMYEARLTMEELGQTIKSLVPTDAIYKVDERITASDATDQPTNTLALNLSKRKVIQVYGRLGDGGKVRNNVPEKFLQVYDNIKKYRNRSAVEWLPGKIEVMFWDYNYAPNSKPWIKDFPDLNSPTTIKFNDNSFSVFLDQKDFNEFRTYFRFMGKKEAVSINGRKMSISYRLPFPNVN